MKVSIIIPAYNEEKIINKTLSSICQFLKKSKLNYEIIAVDDNSSDNTLKIMKSFAKKSRKIKVVHKSGKKGPSGLGSVLTLGFKHASGDVLIPFMGDLSDSPEDIIKLIRKIERDYDIVCGSRFITGGKVIGHPFLKLMAHRMYNKFFSLLFGLGLEDSRMLSKLTEKRFSNRLKLNLKDLSLMPKLY